jgi:hypothetical protein
MRVLIASIVGIAALTVAQPAGAQWRAERPYRGLFAGGVGETEQLLTASGSIGTGWDDNLVADALGRNTLSASDVSRQFRGGVSTGSATLSYSLNRTAVAFGASAGTTVRYYPSLSNQFIRREYGSVGTSAVLGAGFSAQASAVYQPYNLRSMMPMLFEPRLGDPLIVDEDFPSSLEHYFGYGGGLGYTRQLTPRQTFSASYAYGGREPIAGRERFDRHSASANVSYAISRNLAVQLGYGYTTGLYGGSDRHYGSHIINANVNYSRALSFSRRTTLSFGTGSTASRRSRNDSLRFYATGSAALNHEIGRTWSANLAYNRGLQFLETWDEPLFSDSAVAGIGGSMSRRVQAQAAVRWLRGRNHFNSDRGRIEAYGGTAGVMVAVTRYVNTGVTYAYYQHRFPVELVMPGFPRDLERQSIRAYVSVWVPLFQRARRP